MKKLLISAVFLLSALPSLGSAKLVTFSYEVVVDKATLPSVQPAPVVRPGDKLRGTYTIDTDILPTQGEGSANRDYYYDFSQSGSITAVKALTLTVGDTTYISDVSQFSYSSYLDGSGMMRSDTHNGIFDATFELATPINWVISSLSPAIAPDISLFSGMNRFSFATNSVYPFELDGRITTISVVNPLVPVIGDTTFVYGQRVDAGFYLNTANVYSSTPFYGSVVLNGTRTINCLKVIKSTTGQDGAFLCSNIGTYLTRGTPNKIEFNIVMRDGVKYTNNATWIIP